VKELVALFYSWRWVVRLCGDWNVVVAVLLMCVNGKKDILGIRA